ncbi:vomeronasal type-2 receptor 26-like [Pelobates cultripes]|uniref:Vomeronasal type-2 receptor 26-like n=1 Tax=Pelobates cultripes TaxID=61616 RepID=A0AAD1SD21_PELCU|nr:vomeronasal type-2 receptor 26-like [Pelobates cultripes]
MDKTGLHRLFNNKGETVSGYRIMNWKSFTNDSTKIEKVGSFDPWAPSDQQLSMETNLITWKNDQKKTHKSEVEIIKIPISRCSETCQPGSRKVLISQIHSCCYKCVQCAEGEISNISDSKSCLKCPDTEWPNKERDKCIPKQIEFLSISGDWIAIVLVALSVLFCLITAAIFIIFTSYRDTAIVKANNQNLSYILLVSIMMSFLCVFLFFGHPSDVICMLRQTCVGVIYSIAMSSILAKTIIVCIAFKASKPGSIWKKWFGPKLQNSVVLLCSSFQVIICIIWLGISPPYQETDMHSYQEKIIIQCNEGLVTAFYLVLGYMGILAALSFILAFMVRTLPDSFNEAKYITFSMLVFCSVWIAMIPAYLSTKGKSMVAVQIFAILTSSAGLLGFICFPKCYIILWKTELNTRTHLIEKRKSCSVSVMFLHMSSSVSVMYRVVNPHVLSALIFKSELENETEVRRYMRGFLSGKENYGIEHVHDESAIRYRQSESRLTGQTPNQEHLRWKKLTTGWRLYYWWSILFLRQGYLGSPRVVCCLKGYRIQGIHSVLFNLSFLKTIFHLYDILKSSIRNYVNILIFFYAIEKINQKKHNFSNLTVGYHLFDSCLNERKAVKNVLQILSGPRKTVPNYSCFNKKLLGVIGDHYSVTTVPLAQMLGIYQYTQITYGATDYLLSNRAEYPHFFRMLQNDHVHYEITYQILKHFGWTWVGIITSDDITGETESEDLKMYMSGYGICVAYTIKFSMYTYKFTIEETQRKYNIIRLSSARVIILCGTCNAAAADFLMQARDIFHDKTLILSPSWSSNEFLMDFFIRAFNSSLAIEMCSITFPANETFFNNISPSKYPKDKLLENIWLEVFNCLSRNHSKNNIYSRFYKKKLYDCTGRRISIEILILEIRTSVIALNSYDIKAPKSLVFTRTPCRSFALYIALKFIFKNSPTIQHHSRFSPPPHIGTLGSETNITVVKVQKMFHKKGSNERPLQRYKKRKLLTTMDTSISKTPGFLTNSYGWFVFAKPNFYQESWWNKIIIYLLKTEPGILCTENSPRTLTKDPLYIKLTPHAWRLTAALSLYLGGGLPPVTNCHLSRTCIMKIPKNTYLTMRSYEYNRNEYRPTYQNTLHTYELQFVQIIPISQCSKNCMPGYRKVLTLAKHTCCYACIQCSEGEISNISDGEKCIKCEYKEWPNENKTQCIPKLVEFLSYDNSPIAVVFSLLSGVCCLLTVAILVIFTIFSNTPIVKANNKNLSFILLISILLSFLCVFLFIGRPVDTTCMLRQTSFAVIFSVAVSSVLTKTIMVCSAFKATKPGNSWRKWLGVKLSSSIVLCCLSIQVLICVFWLIFSPPFQELDTQSYQRKIIIQCNEGSIIAFYSVLGYMGILAAVSFIVAFLARTLPDSFNEAKYITFSMLVFCSVWIAMIPAYLSTKGKDMVAVEIFAILTSSAGLLGCIFFPKCYIILFNPFEDYQYFQDGDIIIGGVFSVNQQLCILSQGRSTTERLEKPDPRSSSSARDKEPGGARSDALYYKNILAFLFSIEELNKNTKTLPNITLGYHLYDSCSYGIKAAKSVLQILSGPGKTVPNYSCHKGGKLAGVIGDHYSTTTIPIAQILGIYKYTQQQLAVGSRQLAVCPPGSQSGRTKISYGATNYLLSDRNTYPTFFRTMQNDHINYSVISKLIKHFGWNWVGIITSNDDMGEEETQILTNNLLTDGICVAFTIPMHVIHFYSNDVDEDISNTITKSTAQVIVITGSLSIYVAYSSQILEILLKSKTFIFGPTWASYQFILYNMPSIFNGSLAIEYNIKNGLEFDGFFTNVSPSNYPNDMLLDDIWIYTFNCSSRIPRKNVYFETYFLLKLHNCTGEEDILNNAQFRFDGLTSHVTQACVEGLCIYLRDRYHMIRCVKIWPLPSLISTGLRGSLWLNLTHGDRDEWTLSVQGGQGHQLQLTLHIQKGPDSLILSVIYILLVVEMACVRLSFPGIHRSCIRALAHKSLRDAEDGAHRSPRPPTSHPSDYISRWSPGKMGFYGTLLRPSQCLQNSPLIAGRGGSLRAHSDAHSDIPNYMMQIMSKVLRMIPKSQCTESCLPGSRKVLTSSIHTCCYDCVQCSEGEFSNVSDSENCMKCPDNVWPNNRKDQCIPKQEDFLSISKDWIAIVLTVFSILLCILAAIVLGIFISHHDTPIVRANNKNLSFILLVTITLSFLCVFLFLGRPIDITCMLRQASFGVFFAIALSSLLAKTIMVCMAFKATKPSSKWKKWIGVKLPKFTVVSCSSVQVMICVIWLVVSTPFQQFDMQSFRGKIIIQCNVGSVIAFYSVLGYLGILAGISFILAFMVRTLPDSFNEAKYITFSMLVFCSVWIAMIPAYLSSKGKDAVAVEIFAILTSSAGLLCCIFFPKCYIILWRPELNSKTHLYRYNVQRHWTIAGILSWICNSYTEIENCMKCPDNEWPNEKKKHCVSRMEELLTMSSFVQIFYNQGLGHILVKEVYSTPKEGKPGDAGGEVFVCIKFIVVIMSEQILQAVEERKAVHKMLPFCNSLNHTKTMNILKMEILLLVESSLLTSAVKFCSALQWCRLASSVWIYINNEMMVQPSRNLEDRSQSTGPILAANVTLGYHLFDTCTDTRKAVKSVLQILSGPRKTVPNYSCTDYNKVAGFIGDHHSVTTIPIAQILGVYGYSQISYGATDYSLSDRRLYPNFFRMLQNYRVYYKIISKVLKHFKWTWVGIFISNDDSGETEQLALMDYLASNQIYAAFTIKININTPSQPDTIMRIIETIQKSNTQIIILCSIRIEIHQKVKENMPEDRFVFFIFRYCYKFIWNSDRVLSMMFETVRRQLKATKGKQLGHTGYFILGHLPMYTDQGDQERLLCLNPGACANLVKEDIEVHPVRYSRKMSWVFHDREIVIPSFYPSPSTPEEHYLSARKRKLRKKCSVKRILLILLVHKEGKKTTSNSKFVCVWILREFFAMSKLHHYIKNIPNEFNINQDQQLTINSSLITWRNKENKTPRSQCSDNCLPGYRKVPRTGAQACCYDCTQCPDGEISNTTDSENCMRCSDNEWPNEKKDQCLPKVEEFLSYENDIIAVVFSCASVLLFLKTTLILVMFNLFKDTAIVKANNKNLSFVLLVSIMLSFLCVFLFLGRPVDVTCKLRHTSFAVIFSIAISSVLGKTFMIYFAFKATKPGSNWRKWVSVKMSNSVVLILSSFQILINTFWLVVTPPYEELDTHSYQGKIIIQCNEGSVIAFYFVLGYMGLLAAVSFIVAFLARTLPDSFNEAKYITFSMLVFCSVWIAMIPAYLSTKGKNMVAVEIFAILASSVGLLGCIFFPKCYIIILRPEINTKGHLLGSRTKTIAI